MEDEIQMALIHASECKSAAEMECVEVHCKEIKRKLYHYSDCPVDHFCSDCLDVVDMCMRHALECGRGHNCRYDVKSGLKQALIAVYKKRFRTGL